MYETSIGMLNFEMPNLDSQSQKIIRTTSGRCSASLCLELTAQVDIKGEKGFFGNPDLNPETP